MCLIPARGGSKSIPKKNILEILGKPLIAWSILQAKDSQHIDRIIVSTDDDKIAGISEQYGAEVPFLRPKHLARDTSLDLEAFDHALNWLKKNDSYEPDLVVHLRPTGPARRVELIDSAIERILEDTSADSLRSVSVAHQNPFKMWFLDNKYLHPALTLNGVKDAHSVGRQMLPVAYWQNGYVDIIRPRAIFQKKSMVGDKILPFVVNEEICDLDYPEDIPRIEAALKKILEGAVTSKSPVNRHPV